MQQIINIIFIYQCVINGVDDKIRYKVAREGYHSLRVEEVVSVFQVIASPKANSHS